MIDSLHSLAIIGIIAICTFILRAIPFAVFGGRREIPPFIHYLGRILPPAIMATLVFYCLREINFLSGSRGIPEIVCALLAIVLHVWKKNILLTVSVSTLLYMFLIQVIF